MSESQLQKLEEECERLRSELDTISEAVNTRVACEQIIDFVEQADEPFSTTPKEPNPWTQAPPGANPCCIIM
eukprot:CAMPEP_0182464078 /NCGR_PEP_ID=MMETSP1319-20130603/8242_1 /TAXON_ID=172717 /ORGANISM="Bolidomonas pacifica, Strain RCC208" /LENGTH=71 /DNA_ID=CAMNT_0024663689 /DNA_START=25 /DNA_END=240 /DNA_ORIENTATION=+